MEGLILGIAFVVIWKGGQIIARVVAVQFAAAGRGLTKLGKEYREIWAFHFDHTPVPPPGYQPARKPADALPTPKYTVKPPKGGTGESPRKDEPTENAIEELNTEIKDRKQMMEREAEAVRRVLNANAFTAEEYIDAARTIAGIARGDIPTGNPGTK